MNAASTPYTPAVPVVDTFDPFSVTRLPPSAAYSGTAASTYPMVRPGRGTRFQDKAGCGPSKARGRTRLRSPGTALYL